MKPAILCSAASVIATMTPRRIFLVVALAWAGLSPAAAFVPPDSDAQWQTSLNGDWTFKLNGPAAEFVQPEFDDSAWAKIRVPGNWEMQGFEEPIYKEPREGQGLYRRKFAVPDAWRGRRLILRFDGVLFGYECWLNGARVGSFESGFNRCDFDVTSLVKLGAANTLAVRVYRRFKGWQFDTNDDWALSDIYRDVTLLSVPTPHKLRGVNHHDLHPAVGRAMTAEHSTQDVELMKQGNLNAVRTSHYPPAPALLDICDRRGIYVIDEVPFGFGDKDLTDPTHQDILLRRAEATVARDKNHPCVLIWSIGNENPITPLVVATEKRVKALAPTRYRLLPGAQVTRGKRAPADADLTELAEKTPFVFDLPEGVEILAPHYPYAAWVPGRSRTVNLTDLAGDPRIKSPLVITGYNHALGNAFEGLKERWEVIQRERRLSGAFIWHFQDQGLARKVPPGAYPGLPRALDDAPTVIGAINANVWLSETQVLDGVGNRGQDGTVDADRFPQGRLLDHEQGLLPDRDSSGSSDRPIGCANRRIASGEPPRLHRSGAGDGGAVDHGGWNGAE